jgi:hypothetical protein
MERLYLMALGPSAIERKAMENEGSTGGGTPRSAEPLVSTSLEASSAGTRRYVTRRFIAVYAALGIVLVGSVVAFVVFALRPTISPTAAWSSWNPSSGKTPSVAKQIADHVAPRYRLSQGSQLVAIVPSAPAVTAGTQNVAINAVAIRQPESGTTDVKQLFPGKTEMYSFCGLGEHCAIATGQPSQTRGQLVRREALETALYTFKYVPLIDSVIVFMPPRRDMPNQTTVLFFERERLSSRLKMPLSDTLPLRKPPPSDQVNTMEGGTIDALTLPSLYTSNLTQLQSGGALLVLTPAV